MLTSSNRVRSHVLRLVVRAAVVPVLLSACHDNDSTSPVRVATTLAVSSGAAQTGVAGGTLAQPITVLVTDQNNVALPGATVLFTPNAGDGTVSAASVTSDANGLAQVQWTLGPLAGTDSLVASVGSVSTTIIATVTADSTQNQ